MTAKTVPSAARKTRDPKFLLTDTTRAAFVTRLAIALSKSGAVVSAVCPSRSPSQKTRAIHRVFHYNALRPLDSLVRAIEQEAPDVVVPCDDRALQHLYEIHASAGATARWGKSAIDLIENSLGSPESYPILSNRGEFIRVARQEGLPVPESRILDTLQDFKAWQSTQKFPWVLKADMTFGGRGVRIATNLSEAEQYFAELRRMYSAGRAIKRLCVNRDPFWLRPWLSGVKPAISVQSHIPGRPANCAVLCWKGRLLAQIHVQVVASHGPTGPASIVRVVEDQRMAHAAERIARRLKLSGFFGLDFVMHGESGIPYLIEINARATPLCHLQLGKDRDLVEGLYAQITGQTVRHIAPVTQKDVIAYFPQPCNCQSELSESAYLDIPQDELDLVQELLRPWPERSLVWQLAIRVDAIKGILARALFNHSKNTFPNSRADLGLSLKKADLNDSAVEPLVSILIPAFNAEAFIADTVKSALAQTWLRKEIIIVDDGSTDQTLRIARQFASEQLSVIEQKHQGAAAARNAAFSHARGDYIQWLDADDLLAPDKIAKQLQALDGGVERKVLASCPWGRFLYRPEKAEFIPSSLWCDLSPLEWLVRKMDENLFMQTATWLVSRELAEAAGPWSTKMLSDDDGEYFCRVMLASRGVRFVPSARVYYRQCAGGLSYIGNSRPKLDALFESMLVHIKSARALEESTRVRAACFNYLQRAVPNFYPQHMDRFREAQALAADLGRPLEIPRLSWKYAWIQKVFGWKAGTWAARNLPRAKHGFLRSWDKALSVKDTLLARNSRRTTNL